MTFIAVAIVVAALTTPVAAQKRGDVITDTPDRETQLEQLQHAMAPADDVGADVVATAGEVPHPFLGCGRYVDRRQLAGAEEPHELGGVTAIGLHALPGLARRQGGGDDRAVS